MARIRPAPPGKIRTRQHVIADLSVNYLERCVLLCGYTLQRVHHDYGYDLVMWTYNRRGEIEGGIVFVQVKATDRLPVSKDRKTIVWSVSRRDLRLWLQEAYPVILVVYDGRRDRAYWLDMHDYFADYPTGSLFTAGATIRVHIPVANRVTQRAIRRIAQHKNDLHARYQRKARENV